MTEESNPSNSSPSLFIFFIGMVFLVLNVWSFRRAYLLKNNGVSVQGTVSRTYIVKRRGNISFNADYTIDVDGKRYEDTADITRGTFLALRPGGSLAIRYVPGNPSVSEAEDISHSATTLFLTEFLGFPVSLFILFIAFRKGGSSSSDKLEPSSEENIEVPNTVKGIAFTMYPVTDMARARKFYEEDLGLKVARDVRGEWIEYHLWDNCFAITSMLGDQVKPSADSGGRIALEVQDVDDFVSQLKNKGIRVKAEPFSTRVCRMAVVLDPEGNALTLHTRNHK